MSEVKKCPKRGLTLTVKGGKKGKVVAATLTLLLMTMLYLTVHIQPIKSESTNWTVDDDGPADFDTIQEAINAASDGDTILVNAGTYYEHVVVNKTVSLVGDDRNTTIVDGDGTGCVIYVLRGNVSVTGFTIQRGEFGIYVLNATYTEIFGNAIVHNYGSGWGTGVRLDSAGYTLIHDNEITNNWRAVHLIASSPNVSIYRNNVTYNDLGIRVLGGGSNYLSVSDNYIANNLGGYGVAVTGMGGESNYALISGNVIVNNIDGIALGQGSSYNTVVRNNISGNEYGIGMQDSTQNSICNNNIVNNTHQVSITSGSVNAWNGSYAIGGNYWSDYSGLDQFSGPYQNVTDNDGIGDIPYVIDANNRDNYPLMDPWSSKVWDWIVDDNGPADFDTIQEAINHAFDGDSIFVKAGTYYEHVIVNKTVTLVGEDVTATVIDGNETGLVINITSDNVNITGFTVQGGGGSILPESSAGIHLGTTSHCNIFGNRLLDNYVGIIGSPKNANMSNNIIADSHVGFDIFYATFNTISGNRLVANNISIHMLYANSNSVFENNITDNYLCAVVLGYSKNNRFYHNNFLNNTEQIAMLASGWANSWDDDYPFGGNYWSDYGGVDMHRGSYQNETGSDGIGDNPYVIDAANKDNYPLMTPWTTQTLSTDINNDGKVNILDITIVAKAFGSKQGEPAYNEAADFDKNGQVNIIDISMVAKDYGKTI